MLGIINLKGDTSRKKRKRLERTLKIDKTLRMHTHIHTHSHTHTHLGESTYGVVVNVLDCDIGESEF